MSFEYAAPVSVGVGDLEMIRDGLEAAGYVVLPSTTASQIRIRFDRENQRREWPEDVAIQFGNDIYIEVHAGSRSERERVVGALERILAELGRRCEFEEI